MYFAYQLLISDQEIINKNHIKNIIDNNNYIIEGYDDQLVYKSYGDIWGIEYIEEFKEYDHYSAKLLFEEYM